MERFRMTPPFRLHRLHAEAEDVVSSPSPPPHLPSLSPLNSSIHLPVSKRVCIAAKNDTLETVFAALARPLRNKLFTRSFTLTADDVECYRDQW